MINLLYRSLRFSAGKDDTLKIGYLSDYTEVCVGNPQLIV